MKKKFTILMALFALMLITLPGVVKGQSDYSTDYTGNVTLSTTGGTSATLCKVIISSTEYDGIKAGTGKVAGAVKITVPLGTKYLHMHIAGWNGENVTLAVTPEGYSNNISLTSDSGISGGSGNVPEFTFSGDPSTSSYYKVITFTDALSANTDLTFTASSGKRFVIWGVTAEEESTATLVSIALSGTYPTSFYQGDAFSHEGMIVTANYDDASSANVTSSATFSGYNMSTTGDQTVTVSYTENNVTRTQTYSITVNPLPCYTVTLADDNTQLTEASAGAGVTLPSRDAIGDYTFAGWSETNVPTETTTAPTIIPAGEYHPTSNITLYPVYTRTEGGGGTTDVPVSTTIAAYASANNWVSGERYTSITLDENVTISGKSNGNNSKYYSTSPGTWRHYAGDSGEITVTTSSGTLKNVTITYTGNTLTYGESEVTSGTAINVSGTSAVFAVSGSSSNTQVSAIGVTYTVSGSSTTYYWSSPILPAVAAPVITPENNPFLFSTTATITCETTGATIKYSYDGETWSDYSAALTITETKTVRAKAILDQNESFVTTLTITKNLAEPTVTVSGDLTLDLDGETSVSAGTLTAAVTYNNVPVEGATITWSSNHTDIAEINASGVVTIKAVGEVTFTATYAGNNDYAEATGTKTVTVTDSKAPGSEGNPYTVAAAIAYINTLGSATSPNDVYVSGIISQVDSYNSTYHSITYWISDNGTTTNQMEVYSGKGLNGADFSALSDLAVGDIVTVKGKVKKYNNTPEFDYNNQLVSFVRPTYTITLVKSPVDGGTTFTASPSTTAAQGDEITLSATAASGYRFDSYTVVDADEVPVSVTNNKFTMPGKNVTATATFVKTYTVTYHNNGGTGTMTDPDSPYDAGSTVTVMENSFTATAGKIFDYWYTKAENDGSGTEYSAGDEIEINANIDLYAQWRDIVYHITYSVNGTLSDPVDVAYGGNIATLPTPSLSPLTFLGWSTTSATGHVNVTAPYAPTGTIENITLYAVFGSTGTGDLELTSADMPTSYPSEGTIREMQNVDFGIFNVGHFSNSGKIQFKKLDGGKSSYIYNNENIGRLTSIVVEYNSSSYVLTVKAGTSSNPTSGTSITANESTGATRTFDLTGDEYTYFVISNPDKDATVTLNSITINYEASIPVTVTTVTGTQDMDEIAANTSVVVKKDAVLTFTGTNNDAAKLIIEDGGQLITTNSVKATMKKSTVASTATKATNKWYLISSPVSDIEISSFVPAEQTDDKKWNVYRYHEPTRYWNEYRSTDQYPSFSTLTSGVGYLYRSTIPGIEFQGDVNVSPATYKLKYTNKEDNMNGFNLIGNPFSYNIYKGVEIPNTDLEPNFYVLEANGGWTLSYDYGTSDPGPTEIKPNTAILVQAKSTANDKNLTISKSSKGGDYKYGNDQISFRVENSEYSDIACVLFREGHGLNKISHRNAEIPMLYVTKEGENFASANMPDNTSVINLGFEAKTIGQYTFSLKAEGTYSYMHLYDKLTGNDVDMLLEDSYTFIGAPSDRKDRFVLNLNYNAGSSTDSETFAYQSGNDIMVSGEGELQVFDVMGRMVMSQRINGVETVNGLNNGVYIFRMEGKTQKIVVR